MSKTNEVMPIVTPPKKRPKCSQWLNQFLDHPNTRKVYYQTKRKDGTTKESIGVIAFDYGNYRCLARFSDNPDGTVNWFPRTVPNARKGGKPLFVYDRLDIHNSIRNDVADAIIMKDEDKEKFAKEHQDRVEKALEEQADKTIGDKIRKLGGL